MRYAALALILMLCLFSQPTSHIQAADDSLVELCREFTAYSGSKIVFDSAQLPPGNYFDSLPSLDPEARVRAVRLLNSEVRKYPPGYHERLGLKVIGIFRACVSHRGDGFRPYDESLRGYRFYGVWNARDAIVCAYYSDSQLPLTFHHETFHHVDGHQRGKLAFARLGQDEKFRAVIRGITPYSALRLSAEDQEMLKSKAKGYTLEGAVSAYSSKSIAEDKAETARYLMAHLPDALLQCATRSELPGSQRMLHVLSRYVEADPKPDSEVKFLEGLTALALGRPPVAVPMVAREVPAAAPAVAVAPPVDEKAVPRVPEAERTSGSPIGQLQGQLQFLLKFPELPANRVTEAQRVLDQLAASPWNGLSDEQKRELALGAGTLTLRLIRQRLRPDAQESQFVIHGREDRDGINRTLQADISHIGKSSKGLSVFAEKAPTASLEITAFQLKSLRLLGRYCQFIDRNYTLSQSTRGVFRTAANEVLSGLPPVVAEKLRGMTLEQLANHISAEGKLAETPAAAPPNLAAATPQPRAIKTTELRQNPYLEKVDAAITEPSLRAQIRKVQPACVRLAGGSGVNLHSEGLVLTNAHVAKKLGVKMSATFPDGRTFESTCVAIDANLDLAAMRIGTLESLPFAMLARDVPLAGTKVVCIGQPGMTTPAGGATGYKPFHVSVGAIRGYMDDPLGPQTLGRCKHDAWTYWGHSGSPLFDESGAIVALHNSWDSKTAMRHAVPLQAIKLFLTREKLPHRIQPVPQPD